MIAQELIARFETIYSEFFGENLSLPGPSLPVQDPQFSWANLPTGNHRQQDVEKLLDEAADYLDRAVRTRNEWLELYEKAFRTKLEIYEGLKTSTIMQTETQAGIVDLAYMEALTQKDALQSRIDWTTEMVGHLNDAEVSRIAEFAADVAWRSAMEGEPAVNNITGMERKRHIVDSARQQAIASFNLERVQFTGERAEAQTRLQPGARPLSGQTAICNVVDALRPTARLKRALEDDTTQQKLAQATTQGGAFRYPDRLNPLKLRYSADFEAALPRLKKAFEGLSDFYDIHDSLPGEEYAGKPEFFDLCLNWVRAATSRIVAISRQDRPVLITVSLQRLVHESWSKQRAAGKFTLDLTPQLLGLPDSYMNAPPGKEAKPRLRGIALEAVSSAENGLWNATVSTGRAQTFLGRIRPANSAKTMELSAIGEFWNLNPFGRWVFELNGSESDLASCEDLWWTLAICFRRWDNEHA